MPDQHFLIVRLAGIGDVVMASSLLRRLRAEHPAARITWVVGDTAAPLVAALDGVDVVVAVDERKLLRGGAAARMRVLVPLWVRLLRDRPTRAFLLHADRRYGIITLPLLGVPVRRQSRDSATSVNPIPGRYMGDEFARLADAAENAGPRETTFPLAVMRGASTRDSRSGARRVALVPGGARNVLRESGLKRWPADSYAALARVLLTEGREVILAGDSADEWVRPHFAGLPVDDRIGKLGLPETVRLFADCDVVVSHDTGPMHLARLARAPLVALFGPTQPSQFAGRDDTTTVIWGGAHLSCRPCYDGREFARCADNVCMSSIGVDAVLTAVRAHLGAAATPHSRTRQTPAEIPLR